MAFESHPNPANRNARIDRMLRQIDPCGTDQSALKARTSIHQQSALHTQPVCEPGLLGRLQKRPLVAAVLAVGLVLLAAGSGLDLLETASTPKVIAIARGPQPLLDVPTELAGLTTDTTDPSTVSAASVWPDSAARAEDLAEEPPPSF